MQWNPTLPGQEVRIKNNPGKRGITTGNTTESAGRLLVLVDFGPNEKTYKLYDQLELCGEPEEIRDLLKAERCGTPDDLRRILTFEKIKCHLTNVFYSMESSNTEFYAYQFKPVLKFLDSPVGRLLIADEVGLGKTIESIYIWKELQARGDARRLLIVCPAMLRDKWVNDISNRFNMEAYIVDGKKLLEDTQSFIQRGTPHSFIYVTSLEGIRTKNWDEEQKGTRVELARLLEDNPANDEFSLFDLVIIDEGHYLRNPETANNKVGKLLRDSSRHFILLTATPIQINSTNLYQLLKLISPDDFVDVATFKKMLEANKLVVDALRLIWQTPPNIEVTRKLIEEALNSYYFRSSSRLQQLYKKLENANTITSEEQVKLGEILESSSLFGQFMTRNRKREVMENRTQRRAQTLDVSFTSQEKQVYDYITYKIRLQARGQQGVALFRLIARQRQMSSCMVAALSDWKKQGVIDDFLAGEDDEELLYEIFGAELENNLDLTNFESFEPIQPKINIPQSPFPEDESGFNQFISILEQNDTKYQKLVNFLKEEINKNRKEKFVLFAFFRNTLTYLQKRLEKDGIKACTIMGGMARKDKEEVLDKFKTDPACSVLLSSEVGSEGIDLQFCRFVINYDLPWNPMRVEQRIGRIDRLGQKSPSISIINFSLKDTIEEYILEKLYDRIKIFEESLGDLEEILGERTDKLIIDLLNPNLSEQELKKNAEDNIIAIAREINQQRKLENEAMNLVAFSDYIISTINQSRNKGRWLRPEELKAFVEDFFKLQYPGTVITPNRNQEGLFEVKLSDEAKIDLKLFCNQRRFSTPTRLHIQKVACLFDPKIAGIMGKANNELLDPTHPLIQWIRHKYEPESRNEEGAQVFQTVSASRLNNNVDLKPGIYIYVIHRWQFIGIRTETRLAYKVIRLADGQVLPDDIAENLIDKTALEGEPKPNANNLVNWDKVMNTYQLCEETLQLAFIDKEADFEAENTDRCNIQERSAKAYANRKLGEYKERIENLNFLSKTGLIPAIEGHIKKNEQYLDMALKKIKQKRQINTSNPALCAGLIFVEK